MSEYFPELKFSGGRVKTELDLFNYATKANLKIAVGVVITNLVRKTDLVSLKSNVDKLDIDKLKNVPTNLSSLKSKVDKLDVNISVPVPVNLSKVNDLIKSDVVKKMYIMLR